MSNTRHTSPYSDHQAYGRAVMTSVTKVDRQRSDGKQTAAHDRRCGVRRATSREFVDRATVTGSSSILIVVAFEDRYALPVSRVATGGPLFAIRPTFYFPSGSKVLDLARLFRLASLPEVCISSN